MNPYVVLGIPADSSESEIKSAFRDKAKKYHPDKNKNKKASDVFKRCLAAYETLKASDWVWDNSFVIKEVDLDEAYKNFVRENPIYKVYFEEKYIKSQLRWSSWRNRPV